MLRPVRLLVFDAVDFPQVAGGVVFGFVVEEGDELQTRGIGLLDVPLEDPLGIVDGHLQVDAAGAAVSGFVLIEAQRIEVHVLAAGIDAQAGLGNAAQSHEHRGLGRALILKGDADNALLVILDNLIVLDISLVNKNLGNSLLHVGSGDIHRIVLGRVCVTDPRQHVGDGVGDLHSVNLLLAIAYQLAFFTPGISPL